MNRIITTVFTILIIQLLVVKKSYGNEGEVKDCFEKNQQSYLCFK